MSLRLAALAVVAVIVATACTHSSTSTPRPSPSPTPSPTPSAVAWSSCGGAFECGWLAVPLDYSKTGGDTIQIALIRKRAVDQLNRIGSVITNPGGPGVSGIKFLRAAVGEMSNLNRRFDLVSFDPRGVGESAPVRCLDPAQEQTYNALDPVLDDPREKQAAIDADKTLAQACQQNSAKILPFVDTVSVAKDLDLIRAALGDAKLTYLGFSYGTFIGETYANLYPTHIRAMSLDGVIDPALSANDLIYAGVVGFQQNLLAFLDDCRSHRSTAPTCGYAQTGDPGTKLTNLLGRLDDSPMSVGSRELTRALAITGVFAALYDQTSWPILDQALTLADRGSGALLLQISDFYFGEFSLAAINAVNCLDRPVPMDIASYDALGPSFAKASPIFGPAFQYSNLQCAYWPVQATGQAGPLSADGAPTILVVGGTNDPVTPYVWAQAVNRQIAGSVLLTRTGNGHTSYGSSVCSQQAEDAYLVDLRVPAAGTVCGT